MSYKAGKLQKYLRRYYIHLERVHNDASRNVKQVVISGSTFYYRDSCIRGASFVINPETGVIRKVYGDGSK